MKGTMEPSGMVVVEEEGMAISHSPQPRVADSSNASSTICTAETQENQANNSISAPPTSDLELTGSARKTPDIDDAETMPGRYHMVSGEVTDFTPNPDVTYPALASAPTELGLTSSERSNHSVTKFWDEQMPELKESTLLDDDDEVLSQAALLQGFQRLSLRQKLESHHWSEHAHAGCNRPGCRGVYTYTHGIFADAVDPEAPPLLTVEEARLRTRPLSLSIWANFSFLATIIDKYELLIQKRWAKKSKNKKRQLLQSAWASTSDPPPPPMADKHRPDVRYLRNETHCENLRHGCNCRPKVPVSNDDVPLFLWPRLNLEDLAKNEPILLLLNARGRYSPSTFAFADLEPVHFGVRLNRLGHPPFLNEWNMLFTGQEGPETYGQLVSWDEDGEAFIRLHMGRDTSPGEGLWILEIQQRLYQFLINFCKAILHDEPLHDHSHLYALPTEPEPPLPTANGHAIDNATYLVTTRNEIQYHLPAKLDTRRLQDLIASKLAEAEDTLWTLREDPGFFGMMLEDVYQSRAEHLRDTHYKPHHMVASSDGKDKLMPHIVRYMWGMYIPAIDRWGSLLDVVSRLAELKDRLFDNADPPIRPEDDLPPELAMAIYSAMTQLKSVARSRLEHFACRAQCSPPLRHLFLRRFEPRMSRDRPLTGCVTTEDSNFARSPEEEDYVWVLGRMAPSADHGFGLFNCIEEIERITSTPAGRKLISPLQAVEISEFSILAECIRQLELFQPWAATFEADMVDREISKTLHEETAARKTRQRPMDAWTPSIATSKIGANIAKLPYPVGKKATQANVDAMRTAEACLDEFWGAALAQLEESDLLTERVAKVLRSNSPERTAVWVEPTKAEVQAAPRNSTQLRQPFHLAFDHSHETAATDVKPEKPRVKVKSRGVARPPPMAEPAPLQQATAAATIEVDNRTMAVISVLFFTPSPDAVQGEVPWTEFTYMMHDVGFAVEKLMGSAWQFTPGPSLGYTRGIQCHEPHPRSRLALVEARRFGRRLGRAYGWCAETFVVRGG